MRHTDPVERIRKDWKSAFEKATWLDGVIRVFIPTSEAFEQHLAIVHRLNPKSLSIDDAGTLRDLSTLSPLTRLQVLSLGGCMGLTNVDALKNLSALRDIWIQGCTGLKKESVAALKAALPKAVIYGP